MNPKNTCVVMLLLIAILTVVPCASARTTIEGVVTNIKDEPVKGALVQLVDTQRNVIDKVMTDDKGSFKIKRVNDGTYNLVVSSEGLQTSETRLDLTSVGSNVEKVEITLNPPASDIASQEGTPNSVFYLPPESKIPVEALKSFEKGLALDAEKNYKDALEQFEAAVKIDPTFSRAHTHIGIAQQHQGNLDAAIKSFEKGIELNPNDPIPYINLGGLLNHSKRYQDAIPKLTKAIELDPKLPKAHLYLGQTYYNNGNFKEAITPLQTAGSLDPKECAVAYGILGNAFFKLEDYREARAAFKKFLELDPTNPNAEKIQQTIQKLDEALSETSSAPVTK